MGWLNALRNACALPLQCLRGGDIAAQRTLVQEAGSILSSLPHSVVQNAEVELNLNSGFVKGFFTGGATFLCVAGVTYHLWNSYGGSSVRRKYFRGKPEAKDKSPVEVKHEAQDPELIIQELHPVAQELQSDLHYDPEWCLPPGSQWHEVTGDAWSLGEGVPYDPVYGIPPWMEEGNESDNDSLSWEEAFNIPAGALWADISPVGDLVLEAPYQLGVEE